MLDMECIKNFANIIFFSTMSLIAVLSYFQAKKTIFSPIKTEVFKYQLKAFEDIIEYFHNKTETELLKDLDVEMVMEINAFNLYKDYVSLFFDAKVDDKAQAKYKHLSTRVKLIKGTHLDHFNEVNFSESLDEKQENNTETPNSKWKKKEFEMIFFTEGNNATIMKIESFQNSPLVPNELKKLLNEYLMIADDCLTSVGTVIEEVGKEMPTKFVSLNEMKNFNIHGMLNLHSRKRQKLAPKANEILNYINNYLNIEKLLD